MLVHDPWRAGARSYPWRAGARLAAVIALLCLCAGGSLARPAPEAQPARLPPADLPIALPPAPLKLAALEPADRPMTRPARQPRQRGPFGLSAAEDSPYARRWRELQPLMRLERLMLAACRATAAPCPAAATKFNAIIEAGAQPQRPRPRRRDQPGDQSGDPADERYGAIRRARHLVDAACHLRAPAPAIARITPSPNTWRSAKPACRRPTCAWCWCTIMRSTRATWWRPRASRAAG